jgi:cysteine desulfurase
LGPITSRIYLDHAATSPLRPEARAAMEEGFRLWANPSSPHAEGRKARALLEEARERIKSALEWEGELIFTSGASEALAIALGRARRSRQLISPVEHDAVFRAAPGAEILALKNGEVVLPDDLTDAVVAVQQVNSETGAIMLALHDVAPAVAERGGILLADCSQGAGERPLPSCDMAVVSAHKLGGPIGIGALLVRDLALLEPVGGHERGYRAGTENLPGALGFAAALEASRKTDLVAQTLVRKGFSEKVAPFRLTARVGDDRIFALAHPSLSAQSLLIRLDASGIAVSAGSACSSGTLKRSRVLAAFGIDEAVGARTIRVSLGWSTTTADLDRFTEAWSSLLP